MRRVSIGRAVNPINSEFSLMPVRLREVSLPGSGPTKRSQRTTAGPAVQAEATAQSPRAASVGK